LTRGRLTHSFCFRLPRRSATIHVQVYTEKRRERERERKSTHTLNPYPLGRIHCAMFLYNICWSTLCFRFPTNRILLWLGSKRVCRGRWGGVVPCGVSVGVWVLVYLRNSKATPSQAKPYQAKSVVYVICWHHCCIGFPTNRILFCVGSKMVCRGWVGLSKTLCCRSKSLLAWSLLSARGGCVVARNRCSGLLGAACALEIAARTCPRAHTPRAVGRGYVHICNITIFIHISCQ
jgi:hypothetical protein